jgi:hypothetical protein
VSYRGAGVMHESREGHIGRSRSGRSEKGHVGEKEDVL